MRSGCNRELFTLWLCDGGDNAEFRNIQERGHVSRELYCVAGLIYKKHQQTREQQSGEGADSANEHSCSQHVLLFRSSGGVDDSHSAGASYRNQLGVVHPLQNVLVHVSGGFEFTLQRVVVNLFLGGRTSLRSLLRKSGPIRQLFPLGGGVLIVKPIENVR